jgi:hypothetical protein
VNVACLSTVIAQLQSRETIQKAVRRCHHRTMTSRLCKMSKTGGSRDVVVAQCMAWWGGVAIEDGVGLLSERENTCLLMYL